MAQRCFRLLSLAKSRCAVPESGSAAARARAVGTATAAALALVAAGKALARCHESSTGKKAKQRNSPTSLSQLYYGDLLDQRREVLLMGEITDTIAKEVIAQLLYLERQAPGEPIIMIINSGGGKVTAGLAIHDVMRELSSPVHTVCLGQCSSMAAVLLAAGAPGSRRAAPSCRIMIHEPSLSLPVSRRSRDLGVQHERLERSRQLLQNLLSEYTGQEATQLQTLLEVDHYMTADEAVALGLVDRIGGVLAF